VDGSAGRLKISCWGQPLTSYGRCEAPRRGARDRRASTGKADDASRRQVMVGAVPHRVGVRRCGRRTYCGPTACRVMRAHFGDRRAEMHHEYRQHSESLCFLLPLM
jgi:hypothetical protein